MTAEEAEDEIKPRQISQHRRRGTEKTESQFAGSATDAMRAGTKNVPTRTEE
jgi:hypothetical protein